MAARFYDAKYVDPRDGTSRQSRFLDRQQFNKDLDRYTRAQAGPNGGGSRVLHRQGAGRDLRRASGAAVGAQERGVSVRILCVLAAAT